jgi:hypothetical protein
MTIGFVAGAPRRPAVGSYAGAWTLPGMAFAGAAPSRPCVGSLGGSLTGVAFDEEAPSSPCAGSDLGSPGIGSLVLGSVDVGLGGVALLCAALVLLGVTFACVASGALVVPVGAGVPAGAVPPAGVVAGAEEDAVCCGVVALEPPDGAATIESLPFANPIVPKALPSTPKPEYELGKAVKLPAPGVAGVPGRVGAPVFGTAVGTAYT